MNYVFVLDINKQPLNPIHQGWARKLLSSGRAAVYCHYPFTIILKSEVSESRKVSAMPPLLMLLDGSYIGVFKQLDCQLRQVVVAEQNITVVLENYPRHTGLTLLVKSRFAPPLRYGREYQHLNAGRGNMSIDYYRYWAWFKTDVSG